jgi:hypothetical protein
VTAAAERRDGISTTAERRPARHVCPACAGAGTFAGRASRSAGYRAERRPANRSRVNSCPHPLGATMSTRTIAIIALAIAVALVVILFVL